MTEVFEDPETGRAFVVSDAFTCSACGNHYATAEALDAHECEEADDDTESTKVNPEADPFLRLYFTPSAIRSHFECDDDDPTENLTDDDLAAIGAMAIQDDSLYRVFHEVLSFALDEYVAEKAKEVGAES